jgi:hypothetical protein
MQSGARSLAIVGCVAAALLGCANAGPGGGTASGGSTGGSETGGATGSGGATASGGATGTGGVTASGGALGSGGATGSGGVKGAGGALATGGVTGSGGVIGSGGAPGSGGVTGSGGTGSGGVTGSGGAAGAGGAKGGASGSSGGAGGSAGRGGSGGTASAGGAGGANGGAGGADTTCPTVTPRTGGMQICNAPTSGETGNIGSTGYSYNFWSDGKGSGCMTVYGTDAAFKANWMNVGDWIARVGLSFDQTKTYDKIGTFSSDFAYTMTGITTGGFGNIGIYGWSVNPLHEYYIAENWLGKKPNFTYVATFTIDGEGTYDVMTNMQTNAANITGTNQNFVQFWSVRTSPRQCGHISISKHFDEWKSLGLQLGNLEETRILVEAQNNTGTIDFTTATVVVK